MDRNQSFIKEHLLTRNFTDPNKPIDENRLQDVLHVMPTDGGLFASLKRNKKHFKINSASIDDAQENDTLKQSFYKRINKNSKMALKNYIDQCRKSTKKAKTLAYHNKIDQKQVLQEYLAQKYPELLASMPNYDKFLPMHTELWTGYIREVLNIPAQVANPSKLNINGMTALQKLSMADYNGSLLRVVKSRNQNLVGIQGIVLWDSQKNFIMVTKGSLVDEIKCIPKKGTIFNFEVPINEEDALLYTILGDRFKYRSSDRAGRKFKSRRCDDLLYYINF